MGSCGGIEISKRYLGMSRLNEMQKFIISKSGVKVFIDYRDNIAIDRDNPVLRKKTCYPRERYNKGNIKGLCRFGSENSEDIKSWNFFRTMQLRGDISRYYDAINVKDKLQNVLFWGLNVESGEFDRVLKSVLDEIEPPSMWTVQQTEPDVIITGEKNVIFNESKFGQTGRCIDAWNRKEAFSTKHELYKENSKPYFKKDFIDNFDIEGRRYYQLMRNYIVGMCYAKAIDKKFHLSVIVSSGNKAKSGLTHKEEFDNFCKLLINSSNCHFLTWEQFVNVGTVSI